MAKQKEELIPNDTVIVGKKDLGVYKASFNMAQKNGNGKIKLSSRGCNIPAMFQIARWARKSYNYIIESTSVRYLKHDGEKDENGNHVEKTVEEMQVILKKRVAHLMVLLPLCLILSINQGTQPLSLATLYTALCDILQLFL